MESRVAILGIIVNDLDAAKQMNALLHEYSNYIIGRMGIPYRPKEISILSVAVDAPQDIINAMAGRIGKIDGISAKTVYSAR